jgi:molybdopterin-guanine dinucleotide biosynthesis protein A
VTEPSRLGAVVLTGGTAVRMGRADKAALEIGGVTLLERALAATATAAELVVVGDQVPTSRPVTWTREDPPGGGPAAGLLAGLDSFARRPDLVAVLAVDMPRVTPDTFARLVDALGDEPAYDGAVLVDPQGRTQPLCGVYRFSSLQRARPGSPREHGLAMQVLIAGLVLAHVATSGDEARDVDTWEDLAALRARDSARGRS